MNKVYQRINWQNEPSISTPLNETNLNKIDYALDVVDGRVVTFDTTKANQSDLLQTVKTVAYNTTTGVFTFTFWNGNTVTADLNIEKIPVDFSMDEYGVITMTTADGTTYTCDISELIKLYTFNDSSEIDFTTTTDASGNKTITASIVSGSITGDKLQPNYLADCVSAKNDAETAETNAGQSAINSELSSEDSEAWAVGERNGQPVPSTDPAYENNAKWWAQHGTGSSFAGLSDTSFTNLQNGQIAKYNSTTQKWENTEDEGGLLPHFKITSEAGSTVTVVCPDTSVITPTQTSSGIWQCDVPAYGVYTVHAVINGEDAVRTVTVDTVKEYVIHDEHYSYTLNVYAPTGSSIIVTDGDDETYTGTGVGSTAVIFALHQASTTYTITVTYDGLDIDTTITSSATSGGSGSKTITFGTINLTVDEDLIGEIIVMAKGTDTVSKVASSTSMVFYPNATGNWRISAEYEGETVYAEPDPIVVSSLSTPVSAELSLVKIPEGATVLPTDDIQTWLACANITDKSYTTLAEVLADRETFETLIADSNACDYMARSTSWANPNLVPKMTSDSAPSGSTLCSSYYNAYYPYYVFDRNSDTTWYNNGNAPCYVGYNFGTNKEVSIAKITHTSDVTSVTAILQGSNDGTNWTDLTESETYTTLEHTFVVTKNKDDYSRYRVYFSAVSRAYPQYSGAVVELQFYEYADASIVEDKDAMSLIGKYDYCSNALLGNTVWAEAIANSDYFEEVLNVKVPIMTSNTTPSGEAFASSVYSDRYAWKAFDGTLTEWHSQADMPQYVGYKFTSPVRIIKAVLTTPNVGGPKTSVIKGSNTGDANDWHLIDDFVDCPTANTNYSKVISNDSYYLYYELYVTESNYVTGGHQYANISELQFYGRKSVQATNTNGIIHTANGDTVTCNGNTYVADTNGIVEIDFSDFDKGTYTFTSGIAKDPTNLSNYYSKSFKITKSHYGGTTELYLMPDTVKTLYWWGYKGTDLEDCISANGWSLSGYALDTPTFNTSEITLAARAWDTTGHRSAVASKTQVSASKLLSVAQGIIELSGYGYGSIRTATSKSFDNQNDNSQLISSTNMIKVENSFTQGNYYVFAACDGGGSGQSSKIYALWYE